jgi:hypothetical protein
LSDLELQIDNCSTIAGKNGAIHNVDVVVKDASGRQIGFEKTKDGSYRVISDCSGLNKEQEKKQRELINKIRQRYSYNKVVSELKSQGYVIAEEEKIQNNTIRLVARKWS